MAIVITSVAEELFEKICARFTNVGVNDAEAKETQRPEDARFFNFNYLDENGTNFGNVTISIADEENLKISYGMNISAELNTVQKDEWYDFLRDMRMFAKRNLLGFIPKDISKDRLDPKDIKKMATVDSIGKTPDASVTESRLFGTTKTSYEPIAPGVRLTIRHNGAIDDTKNGARTRKIQSVYIEDAKSQRFLAPTNHLSCCRALARHVANEGSVGDEFGQHLLELSNEMSKIKTFVRASRNKMFENDEANEMAKAAVDRFHEVKRILGSLSHHRSYTTYKESWEPSHGDDSSVDLEEVKSKFVTNNFDPRLEEALPYVYAAHKAAKEKEQMSPVLQTQMDEFSESLDGLMEDGNDSLNDAKLEELMSLMKEPLMAGGLDGIDSGAALQSIFSGTTIDLNSLMSEIYKIADINDEVDIRPIVFDWLQKNVPDIGQKIEQSLEHGAPEEEPEEPAAPPPAEPAPVDPNAPPVEPVDPNAPPAPAQESVIHEDDANTVSYRVESKTEPICLYTGTSLDLAKKALQKAQESGNSTAKLYRIKTINGKKVKSLYNPNKATSQTTVEENATLADIRRLAGLK